MIRETFKLSTEEVLNISLVRDVKNVENLRRKVINREIQCCFITPRLILDTFQIAIAADKAALAKQRNKLVTKSVYSEILFNLSVSKHISKSLVKFGCQENDTALIVVVIGDDVQLDNVLSQVEGTEDSISKIKDMADVKSIEKEYNIKPPEPDVSALLNSVITRIATKCFL